MLGASTADFQPTTIITVGIDIGCESTKVVLGPAASCEIVRSSVGGHATPTAVSFATSCGSSNTSRLIGADANLKSHNALIHFNRLLPGLHSSGSSCKDDENNDPFRPF